MPTEPDPKVALVRTDAITPDILEKLKGMGLLAPINAGELHEKLKAAGMLAPPRPPTAESKSYSYRVTKKTWREEALRFCEPGETYVASKPHYSSALEPMDEETRVATAKEKERIDAHRAKHEGKPAVQTKETVEAIVAAALEKGKRDDAQRIADLEARNAQLEADLEKATAPDPKGKKGKGGKPEDAAGGDGSTS